MYIFNIENVIKMTVKNLRKFIFENIIREQALLKKIVVIRQKKAKKKEKRRERK